MCSFSYTRTANTFIWEDEMNHTEELIANARASANPKCKKNAYICIFNLGLEQSFMVKVKFRMNISLHICQGKKENSRQRKPNKQIQGMDIGMNIWRLVRCLSWLEKWKGKILMSRWEQVLGTLKSIALSNHYRLLNWEAFTSILVIQSSFLVLAHKTHIFTLSQNMFY